MEDFGSKKNLYYPLSIRTRKKPPKRIDKMFEPAKKTLNAILKNLRIAKHNRRKSMSINTLDLLDKIIPNSYFGSTFNRKLFYKIVKKILTQSSGECVYKSSLYLGFEYHSIPWLRSVKSHEKCQHLLMQANYFVLECVVKSLIGFYYKDVRTYNGFEVQFIRREAWNSFNSQVLHHLLHTGQMVETTKKTNVSSRGNLIFVPKNNRYDPDNFRPIVKRATHPLTNQWTKQITSAIYKWVRDKEKTEPKSLNLCDKWAKYVAETSVDKKLYAVKVDVKDAFGNINLVTLCDLIRGINSKYLTVVDRETLVDYIRGGQVVTFRGRVYEWKHGLLQGDQLSSCLCELYMSNFNFEHSVTTTNRGFLHRTVDDFFYCSTSPGDVDKFVTYMRSVHTLNESKTVTSTREIAYCGVNFNVESREARKSFHLTSKFDIRHKFRLWNIMTHPVSPLDFIQSNLLDFGKNQSCFTQFELNTRFNSPRRVLENFYTGMVYLAYKFDACLMAVVDVIDDYSFIPRLVDDIVKGFGLRVLRRIEKFRGEKLGRDVIGLRVLTAIGYRGFIVVLKRRFEVYKNLVGEIRYRGLRIDFRGLDYSFFGKIPEGLRGVRINRAVDL